MPRCHFLRSYESIRSDANATWWVGGWGEGGVARRWGSTQGAVSVERRDGEGKAGIGGWIGGEGERRGRRGRSESSCAVEKEEGTVSYAPLLITTADAQAP